MSQQSTLILLCGKMGAGKSTKSKDIATKRNAVLISEDDWLSALYPEQISTFDDDLKFSNQLKPLIKAHVQAILTTGTNVIMDFPANTIRQREWLFSIAMEIGSNTELIYLKVSDKQCLIQIAQRSIEQPERQAFDTKEMFYYVSQYFSEPEPSEIEQITTEFNGKTIIDLVVVETAIN